MTNLTPDVIQLQVPPGFCQCGCGRRTKISPFTNKTHNIKRGDPNKFIVGHATKGRFQSIDLVKERFWKKVSISSPENCWNWEHSIDVRGYGQFYYNGKLVKAHRMAYILTHGSIPQGKMVCHKCSNRLCQNPSHLYAGTAKDNARDMIEIGHASMYGRKGSEHPCAKLTESDVKAIRQHYDNKWESIYGLAEKFEVSYSAIYSIVNHTTWRHIK